MHLRSASVLPFRVGRTKDNVGVQTVSSFQIALSRQFFLQAALSVLIKVVALTGLSAVIKGTVKKVSTGEITSSSGLMGSQFYQCTHGFS